MDSEIQRELERRLKLWDDLKAAGGPDGVSPKLVKDLRIHRGQQGIFRDLEFMSRVIGGPASAAVGILHTGSAYADDLSEEGVIYHYPDTGRGDRDANEVASLKACRDLNLPLFVVIKPTPNAATRNVRLGWAQEYDDESQEILIAFRDSVPPESSASATGQGDETPFSLRIERPTKYSRAKARPNQWRFRFDVLRRYGSSCAVCSIRHPELLQAAHLCPVEDGGTDDPRNGLVFCLTHHRAFDLGLFRIDPETLRLCVTVDGPGLYDLGVMQQSITHIRHFPHREALEWTWLRRHNGNSNENMPGDAKEGGKPPEEKGTH